MKRAMLLLALNGCVLGGFRQQCTEYARIKTGEARDDVVSAINAVADIAKEVNAATAEERPINLAPAIEKAADFLTKAHAACEEAGKTLAVVQEDIGRSEKPAPAEPQAAEAMRMEYRAAIKAWKMALSWAKSQIPMLKNLPGGGKPGGGGWTPSEIAAAITAITTALAGGAATVYGKKAAKNKASAKALASLYAEETKQRLDATPSDADKLAALKQLKAKQEKAKVRMIVQEVLKEKANGV